MQEPHNMQEGRVEPTHASEEPFTKGKKEASGAHAKILAERPDKQLEESRAAYTTTPCTQLTSVYLKR